ncbi:MAG TPA: hypothetical protein VMZ06_12410 [Candidatus Bathyarchaeia archaeon]|nr:hypothetical protein [Candidatus Bathyarchaeia archaeon]
MRRVSHLLLTVTMVVVGITLAGCPEEDGKGGLGGSWITQFSEPRQDFTFSMNEIYKFFDDGKAAWMMGYAWSGSGWSAEMRWWMIGSYSTADGVVTISFSDTQCEEVAAKRIIRGAVPEDADVDLDLIFSEMTDWFYAVPLSMVTGPYGVKEDTLTFTGFLSNRYSRFDDDFDYTNPDSNSCAP